jgi:hypothetical protein
MIRLICSGCTLVTKERQMKKILKYAAYTAVIIIVVLMMYNSRNEERKPGDGTLDPILAVH